MRTNLLILLAALSLLSSPASAQTVEVGGTLGTGIKGREGSFGTPARAMGAVHGSLWLADRLETGLRIAWLDRTSRRWAATYYYGCSGVLVGGHCLPSGSFRVVSDSTSPRTFVDLQVLYHFRAGKRVRPFAGVAIGQWYEKESVRCEVPGCELLQPGLRLGDRTVRQSDLAPTFGASAVFRTRFVVRGGVSYHNPLGEDWSAFETFVGIGYRL
jgi:hypothetical protein